MFDLINANTVSKRMKELNRFIDFWYGPHKRSYGSSDLEPCLPTVLTAFYKRNAFRPPVNQKIASFDFFYQGGGSHHLLAPTDLGLRSKDRVKFFQEYQGDFDGFTLKNENDPEVWLEGYVPYCGFYSQNNKRIVKLASTLSFFLVTHVVLTSLFELDNSRFHSATSVRDPNALYYEFHGARADSRLIWDAYIDHEPHCPYYVGKIYLFRDTILVFDSPSGLTFGSNDDHHANLFKSG
jgi:hypothetical protein